MKNRDRTIKAATLQELDKKIMRASLYLAHAEMTVSSYFGKNASITKSWRSMLAQIRDVRASTKASFKNKISN